MPIGQEIDKDKKPQDHKNQGQITEKKVQFLSPVYHESLPAPRHIKDVQKEEEARYRKIINDIPWIDHPSLETDKMLPQTDKREQRNPEIRKIGQNDIFSQDKKDKGQ